MAATLVRLRWRLTANNLTRSAWALVGVLFGVLYALGALTLLTGGAVALGTTATPTVAASIISVLGALVVLGWALVPLTLTGVDSTLDPRAMTAWIAPSARLARGLVVAGAAGIPGLVTALVFILPILTWALAGQWVSAVLALILAPVALVTCVLASRITVIGLGVATSRRGREIAGIVGFFFVLACSVMPSVLDRWAIGPVNLERIAAWCRIVGYTPLGWAFAAPGFVAQGRVLPAVLCAVAAIVLPLVLMPAWTDIVRHVMTGPARVRQNTRAYDAASADGSRIRAVESLPWQHRLSAIMPSPAATIAARCLRYWRRDPRYIASGVSIIALPLVLGIAFTRGSDVESVSNHNLASVAMLLGPMLAFFGGWSLHNDVASDSTALWQQIAAGVRGRDDRLGRVVALALWQVPVIVVLTVVVAAVTGLWSAIPAAIGLSCALFGAASAWSCFTSVLMPYEVNAPDDSMWKSRGSGMVMVASLVQMVGLGIILLLASPIVAGYVAIAVTHSYAWGWLLFVGGLAWGAGLLSVGILIGGRIYERRIVNILATIRSWPGHEDNR